ncbi:hypothetical protein [Aquabacterium sp. CECT 9606]|uniref:hypothetical protein n=1 Tax=Aquabacterium sp. CECT 9606 TaxID=2845822 RepID=UPI001E326A5C|nr:hypothetical protein [Aquabacterium sp. CECT 9606]CAH0352825.1 hypothetical protein AQB9606_02833 [Aquabacterium sp. CECT 9606]
MKFIVALLVLLIVVLLGFVYYQDQQWEAFKRAHECKVVARVSGDVVNTTGFVGGRVVVGIGSTPDKTGWLCSDGVVYYR